MPQSKFFLGTSLPFLGFNSIALHLQPGDYRTFCDKSKRSTLSKTLDATRIHASTNGVSTIAIPKLSCGQDQMNWQEVVKLLRDIFTYADVQNVVYTLEENGVPAMSAKGVAEFYADDEIEQNRESFYLKVVTSKQTLLKILNPANQTVTSSSRSFGIKITTIDSLITIIKISQRN